jgi:hypothetical protein
MKCVDILAEGGGMLNVNVPENHQQSTILWSESVLYRHLDAIKRHICRTSGRRVRSFDRFRLNSLSPLNEDDGKSAFRATSDSEIVGEVSISNPPNLNISTLR